MASSNNLNIDDKDQFKNNVDLDYQEQNQDHEQLSQNQDDISDEQPNDDTLSLNDQEQSQDNLSVDSTTSSGESILRRQVINVTSSERRLIIQSGEKDTKFVRSAAALEIQRFFRGYNSRCRAYDLQQPLLSVTALEKLSGSCLNDVDSYPADLQLRSSRIAKDFNVTFTKSQSEPVLDEKRSRLSPEDAVVIMQRAWRKHIDIQVYKYYRDLINFRTRGDPALMLKCINPTESQLLDSAAGVHVRFRLAGARFPPNIYYKIFTHRPIVDMCANSPKDYTSASCKKASAKDLNNRNKNQQVNKDDHSKWYHRWENNGWRLVSDRLIHHLMSDPITWESSQKKYHYPTDKLVRKQDVEKRRKEKKIKWMQQMYFDGMLKAKAEDPDTIKLIEGAAAGMVATVEASGPGALEEWEVDELLDWTTSLNFDDYLTGWKEVGTSANSEKKNVDRLRMRTNDLNQLEFTMSTGPSRFQSTRQSHNTPVSGKLHLEAATS